MRIELADGGEIYLKGGEADLVGGADFSKGFRKNGKPHLKIESGMFSITIEDLPEGEIDAICIATQR